MSERAAPIEVLGPADLDAVLVLERQAQAHPWTRGQIAEELRDGDDRRCFGARQGEAVVGWVSLRRQHDEAWVLQLAVAPTARRVGLGRRLVEAAGEQAAAWGAELWLEVRESNGPARALYAAAGFEERGLRPGYYPTAGGGREAAVILRRRGRR